MGEVAQEQPLTYEGLSVEQHERLRQAIRERDPLRGVPMPLMTPEQIRARAETLPPSRGAAGEQPGD